MCAKLHERDIVARRYHFQLSRHGIGELKLPLLDASLAPVVCTLVYGDNRKKKGVRDSRLHATQSDAHESCHWCMWFSKARLQQLRITANVWATPQHQDGLQQWVLWFKASA